MRYACRCAWTNPEAMKRFQDLPIRQKMLVMTLLICGAVLVVAILALFNFQMGNFRKNFQEDHETLAAIIATNSSAIMSFAVINLKNTSTAAPAEYDKDAAGVLASLEAKPTVLTASLVSLDGRVIAHYTRMGNPENAESLSKFPYPEDPETNPGKSAFVGEHLLLTQQVVTSAGREGILYLRADY